MTKESQMVERVARAMQLRASKPVCNLASLDPVLVGSLGDAWVYLASAAIEAMREPTYEMRMAGPPRLNEVLSYRDTGDLWKRMIDAALQIPEPK